MEDGHEYKILPEVGAGVHFDLLNARGGLAIGRYFEPAVLICALLLLFAEVAKSKQLSKIEEEFTKESLSRPASAVNRTSDRGSLAGMEFARRFGRLDADSHKRQNPARTKTKSADRERFDRHMQQFEEERAKQTPRQRAEESFKAVSDGAELKHPTNPNLTPVQSWSVLPDETLWASQIVHVVFEDNPYVRRTSSVAKRPRTMDPNDLTGDAEQYDEEQHREQLARSIIRTPDNSATLAAGLMGVLLAPSHAEAVAAEQEAASWQAQLEAAAQVAQRSAPAETPVQVSTGATHDEVHCQFVRQYNMALQAYPHPHGSKEEDEEAAAAIAQGQPPQPKDTQLVLVWDNENGVVRILPLAARIQAAELHTKDTPEDVLLRRRTLMASEQQEEDDAIAGIMTDDLGTYRLNRARAALAAVTARQEQQIADKRRALEAMTSGTSSSAAAAFSAPVDTDLFDAEDDD